MALTRAGTGVHAGAQFVEPSSEGFTSRGVVDGLGEEVDDVFVAPEGGEVFERQVHRPGHLTRRAQRSQLVDLSLMAGHERTVPLRADLPLDCR